MPEEWPPITLDGTDRGSLSNVKSDIAMSGAFSCALFIIKVIILYYYINKKKILKGSIQVHFTFHISQTPIDDTSPDDSASQRKVRQKSELSQTYLRVARFLRAIHILMPSTCCSVAICAENVKCEK